MSGEMKYSGVAWIGDIPNRWKVVRHKNVMHKQKDIQEIYHEQDIISLTMGGVIVRDLNAGGKMPTSFDGYQHVYPNDLLLCLFDIDVTPRCVGLVKNAGVTSPAYSRFITHDNAYAPYYDYLLRYIDDYKCFLHLSKNLRSSLTETDFGVIYTCLPSLVEQKAIADFLDKKCNEIDELVALQEKMIEELKAYKQSVITEAVCKGLNPNVPMKDSGVNWIGEIPEDWQIHRVKGIVQSFSKGEGITKEEIFADGDMSCVRYGEIYSKYNNSFVKCISATKLVVQKSPRYFEKGDILCAGTGELVEEIGKSIVYMGDSTCLAGGDIIIIKHKQNPIFLNYALNSRYAQAQKSCNKSKLKVVHISASDIGNVLLVLPPITEQQKIAEYLDEKCNGIDQLISIKQQKIVELKDYKKSLIYEYTTGKKEVKL